MSALVIKNINNLLFSLEKMISELNLSGKKESACFFFHHYDEIRKHGDKIPCETISELSSCRAMSQYANFSLTEEKLLDNVVANALIVKNTGRD